MGRALVLLWLAGCGDTHSGAGNAADMGSRLSDLTATCAPTSQSEGDVWRCPEPITVACSELDTLPPIAVASPEGTLCDADALQISDPGTLTTGTNTVTVRDAAGTTLCSTEIEVVGGEAPVLEPHSIALWPPNHKFHEIAVEDCVSVTDSCGGALRGEFIWASSDEPVDDKGDGHHSPDIRLSDDCTRVSVRAERQGPKDGRVYKLGVRVVDGSGNTSEGECTIVVDHDQRGVIGADSGEAYRVLFDGSQGGPACDGEPDEPPPPPTVPPPPRVPPPPDSSTPDRPD